MPLSNLDMESAASGKTALVLSAGGMFGAYQAGAWQVLEELFSPDLVIGASVGSLNGWVIASHQPASELVERWMALDELRTISFRIPRSWADGLIEAQLLENWIRELADTVPQIPFGLVTTHLPSLRPRLSFKIPVWTGGTYLLRALCQAFSMYRDSMARFMPMAA